MNFFESVKQEPPDAIFGLNAAFSADRRESKIDLGAGVYRTAALQPLILNSVKQAESLLIESETSKEYLPIDGLREYVRLTMQLVHPGCENAKNIHAFQTPGGTAALRIGGTFLKELSISKIYLPTPTWANHPRIFTHAGLGIDSYPYFNPNTKSFDCRAMVGAIEKMAPHSAILLHASCHNPTGFDPSLDQWEEIFQTLERRGIIPLFDLAYQGFGDGIEEDSASLSLFLRKGLHCIVAVSHSKNFGIYAERCGALFAVCRDETEAKRVGSRISTLIRGLYSNPPCHGARIVSTILSNETLRIVWFKELTEMRERITSMRSLLKEGLHHKLSSPQFDMIGLQKGMFSYTGLSEQQVERLTAEFAIYLPKDGRINVAGLNSKNLEYVIDAIKSVV